MLALWNQIAQELGQEFLPGAPGENDVTAATKALHAVIDGYETTEHVWRTAQLADGNIVGQFSDSTASAVVSLAFWWRHDVVWIVEDPGCLVHERYRESVRAKDYHAARWVVTDAPVDVPTVQGETLPESVPVELF